MKRLIFLLSFLFLGCSVVHGQVPLIQLPTAKTGDAWPNIGVGVSQCVDFTGATQQAAGRADPFDDHTFTFHVHGSPSAILVTATASTGGAQNSQATSTLTAGDKVHFTGVFSSVCIKLTSATGTGVFIDAAYVGQLQGASTATVTAVQPTGTNLHVVVDSGGGGGSTAQGAAIAGVTGGLGLTSTTTSAPTYSNNTANPPSTDAAGNTRVIVSGGATAAKQPALGTAASPSPDVITAQGITNGTPLPISIASGGISSGGIGAGAGVAGAFVDGSILTLGAKGDAACATSDTTPCSIDAALKGILGQALSTTPVPVNPTAATSGGATNYPFHPTASDNHQVVKNGAGQVYYIHFFSIHTAAQFIRLYNAGTGFNGCNSATNLVWSGIIPGVATGTGGVPDISIGMAFSTGISVCVTGAFGDTDTTSAAASVMDVNIGYK